VEHYAGIDVSLELSSVCVVDERGKIVKEAKVASEPEALVCFFKELGFPVNRIGFEEVAGSRDEPAFRMKASPEGCSLAPLRCGAFVATLAARDTRNSPKLNTFALRCYIEALKSEIAFDSIVGGPTRGDLRMSGGRSQPQLCSPSSWRD
jgi:hypothetical protein